MSIVMWLVISFSSRLGLGYVLGQEKSINDEIIEDEKLKRRTPKSL